MADPIAYLDLAYTQPGQPVKVLVRDSPANATVVKPPFYDEEVYGWRRTKQGI